MVVFSEARPHSVMCDGYSQWPAGLGEVHGHDARATRQRQRLGLCVGGTGARRGEHGAACSSRNRRHTGGYVSLLGLGSPVYVVHGPVYFFGVVLFTCGVVLFTFGVVLFTFGVVLFTFGVVLLTSGVVLFTVWGGPVYSWGGPFYFLGWSATTPKAPPHLLGCPPHAERCFLPSTLPSALRSWRRIAPALYCRTVQ